LLLNPDATGLALHLQITHNTGKNTIIFLRLLDILFNTRFVLYHNLFMQFIYILHFLYDLTFNLINFRLYKTLPYDDI